MSSHLALPRNGHLAAVLHIFAYLETHQNSETVYDPTEVTFDLTNFPKQYWSYSIYGNEGLKKTLPSNMPLIQKKYDYASICGQ
mmetsp:Transcript_13110/g.12733  ORF Transcript_13110/g.12733 Transcript_13110/m.12733 type:complete len:84 (-) Transcript_13110:137-388(-)